MFEIEAEITINRPPAVVFEFARDLSNRPAWEPRVREAAYTSSGPIGLGTRGRTVMQNLGRHETRWEIVEYEEGRSLTMAGVSAGIPIRFTYLCEPVGDSTTRLRFSMQGQPAGWRRLLQPLVRWLTARQWAANMPRFKAHVEGNS